MDTTFDKLAFPDIQIGEIPFILLELIIPLKVVIKFLWSGRAKHPAENGR
jgi:hypothetical protein